MMAHHIIHFTVFDNAAATGRSTHRHELSLLQISSLIQHACAPTKSRLPWIKLARFGELRSARGSLRHNANVQSISGVELDYDGESLGFDEARTKLKKLKCRALMYTSPSHAGVKPRWRILFPTSKELEPDMRHRLAAWIDGFFGHIFDPASFTLSQSFYFGVALDNPNPDHRVAIVDGAFIDLRPELERFDLVTQRIVQRQNHTPASAATHDAAILAIMRADAGKGVSTDPDDYFPDDADIELKIRVALAVIPSDNYFVWLYSGAAIYDALGDAGYELFDEWSQGSSKYQPRACARKWCDCRKMRSIKVATIFWYADQYDRGWRTLYRRHIGGEVTA